MTVEETLSATKRRTRAEIQQLVAEFRSSGMRRSDFCRIRGLSFGTLSRHLKKLRWKKSNVVSSVSPLLTVEFAATKSQHEPRCGLTLVLSGGRRVEVNPDFDTSTLARLVSALERV